MKNFGQLMNGWLIRILEYKNLEEHIKWKDLTTYLENRSPQIMEAKKNE
jgi:hypothetical protein